MKITIELETRISHENIRESLEAMFNTWMRYNAVTKYDIVFKDTNGGGRE